MIKVITYSLICLALICLLPIENAISQNLLVNGSFELNDPRSPLPTATSTNLGDDDPTVDNPNDTTIAGWTVNEIDWINGLWNASEGSRSLDMNGWRVGYIEQSFNTVVGTNYKVTFDMAGASNLPALSVRGTAAGSSFDFGADPAGNSGNTRIYETKTFYFTANSTSTTLRLASLNFSSAWPSRAQGPALDNVSVEVVPDNSPPDVSNSTASPSAIWPPNNKMVDITIGGVTDPDGDPVTITVTKITDNEGSDPRDAVTGTSPQVRAQRNGKGNGRTYTIFFDAYDGTATVSGTVTVSVQHDKGKGKLKKGIASTSLPRSFALNQNYPNPFNPVTSISYNIQKAGMVELSVYDITGKLVKNLINRQQSAGTFTLKWDGTNETGQKVASGTYIYRLQAEGFVQTKKMILIK